MCFVITRQQHINHMWRSETEKPSFTGRSLSPSPLLHIDISVDTNSFIHKGSQESRESCRSQWGGLELISKISLTLLEALHFGITTRCWNWTFNSERLAERKKWKNWSVVSRGVGCATFTLTNAWCHPFEQAEMKGNESEEVGNLWMMSTVILLDTAVCHFSLLIFTLRTTSHAYLCVCVWKRGRGREYESECV